MSTIDYDTPRQAAVEEDSLEELQTRRTTAQSAAADLDGPDPSDVLDLPGADLSDEELTVAVVPMQADEFRCSSCFLVHHRSQLARQRNGEPICTECS
ncbi:hypothetical protein F4553_002528 [Allocatelliglobosispora scoriae]|uniref:DUF4193 domain-containing protein n=1 Tax=Allocatelliglobosispora scoriae TaxID=643052 RepID=A0A841BPN2_9ACTN|nr:DUF4193 domain-containing protein [Allocatelliglobosispora scoriae]MBB5869149.1 hypothetical protein [Allocatelliglobosispora scoriae]